MDRRFTLQTAISLVLLAMSISASQPPTRVVTGWTAETYPNPTDARCGNYSSSICDPDGILGGEDAVSELVDLINLIDMESCACGQCNLYQTDAEESEGFKFGIAAVDKLKSKGSGNITWEQIDLDVFAVDILRKWHLGSCRNGLIIAVSNATGQYATAMDETTQLRLHPECLVKRGISEDERLKAGQLEEGLKLIMQEYKQLIKEGSCVMSKTIWVVMAFTLAPIGIIFAVFYLACKSSNYVIKSAREKKVRQMISKKLAAYESSSRTSSESTSSLEQHGCSTSGQYRSIGKGRHDVPSVSQAVTRGDVEQCRQAEELEERRRYSDIWVKATAK
ncbi:uncharacterized protein LOC135485334 [Lineus longissimus]|uniref:uncharacterized protein LOC135485334 n=1 Tax=Lineus longissimus TaxID=88925 RepID=UPI002B4D218D